MKNEMMHVTRVESPSLKICLRGSGNITCSRRLKIIFTASMMLIGAGGYCQGSFADDLPANVVPKPEIASQCMGCHGPAGISQNPHWPNIAGQQSYYIAKQLRDFRSGIRKNGMMEIIVGQLNDQDIDNLAKYFSSLPSSPGK